jgi:acetyltransferase
MAILIDYCRARGTRQIAGEALAENGAMLELAKCLGFGLAPPADGVVQMRLSFADP